jgi:site-specific DNA recombinase
MEEGESAKTTDRTELKRLLEYCRVNKNKINYVVVYAINRLTRSVADHVYLTGYLLKYGIKVKSVTEPTDNTPAGKLQEQIMAVFAEFDNNVRADRTITGMKAAVEKGRFPHRAPLGYRNILATGDGPNIIPDDAAPFILQAFEMLDRTSESQVSVLKTLNALGFKTEKGKPVPPQTFTKLIRNPIYKGMIHLPEWGLRGKGSFDPIVSEEMFDRVQVKLSGKTVTVDARHRLNPDFPLRVFVSCAHCGTALTGSFAKKKYGYYWCRDRSCRRVKVSKNQLERDFIRLLERVQVKPEYLALFTEVVRDVWQKRNETVQEQTKQLKNRIDALKQRKNLIFDALIEKKINQQTYEEQIQRVDEELVFAQMSLSDSQLDELEVEAALAFAQHALTNTAVFWFDSNVEQKQKFQRMIFPEGISYSIEAGFGTGVTSVFFKQIEEISSEKSLLVSPMGFEPMLSP